MQTREVEIPKECGGGMKVVVDVKGLQDRAAHRDYGLYVCERKCGAQAESRRLHLTRKTRAAAASGKGSKEKLV